MDKKETPCEKIMDKEAKQPKRLFPTKYEFPFELTRGIEPSFGWFVWNLSLENPDLTAACAFGLGQKVPVRDTCGSEYQRYFVSPILQFNAEERKQHLNIEKLCDWVAQERELDNYDYTRSMNRKFAKESDTFRQRQIARLFNFMSGPDRREVDNETLAQFPISDVHELSHLLTWKYVRERESVAEAAIDANPDPEDEKSSGKKDNQEESE